jgi:hypothetical protein
MIIELTLGKTTIIDDEDKDLANMKWHTLNNPCNLYAVRSIKRVNGKRDSILLHRLILERKIERKLRNDEYVDHINRDSLDNRRQNIRIATNQQNQQNRRILLKKKTSKFKGVYYDKYHERWCARIVINKKATFLGYFENEVIAAKIYDEAAKRLYGEFCNTNF